MISSRPRLLMGVLLLCASCASPPLRPRLPGPPPYHVWDEIIFEDTDAFDILLEKDLASSKPAIRILLDTDRPNWPPRLNAWLSAYLKGGRLQPAHGKGVIGSLCWLAGTTPTSSEARQLIESLLDRLERHADKALSWWQNERQRQQRIELLRGYNLETPQDPKRGNKYSIELFNGRYSDID